MQKDDIEEDKVIQDKLKDLSDVILQCEEERSKNEHTIVNINKTHQRMKNDQKQSPYFKAKLKGLYNTAIEDANCEANIIRKALDTIQSIRAVHNAKRLASKTSGQAKEPMRRGALMLMLQLKGQSLPLWIGKRNESPPPLCGAVPAKPNFIASPLDMVAAKVKSSNGEDMWILAEVVSYFPNTCKYEVDDIDEEQRERYTLSRKKIIPLPTFRANPETNPEALFAKDTMVLAVYPQTTCFYPAVIKEPPAQPQDEYKVLFKDSSYPNDLDLTPFNVCQKYVVSVKDGRKK